MGIIGVGIDLHHLPRLLRFPSAQKLALKILHPNELAHFQVARSQYNFLSTRWAIKEAVYKACYPKQKLKWKQIEIWKIKDTKPYVTIHPPIQNTVIHISVSHDGDYVHAIAIAESLDTEDRKRDHNHACNDAAE